MTDSVYMAFRRVLRDRGSPKMEMLVDGYTGFVFLDKEGKPKVGMHLQNYMRGMQRKYVELFGNTLPKVTPHVLRHTFCTNAQQAGLDVKACNTSWDTPTQASPWMSTPTATMSLSKGRLNRLRPTSDMGVKLTPQLTPKGREFA